MVVNLLSWKQKFSRGTMLWQPKNIHMLLKFEWLASPRRAWCGWRFPLDRLLFDFRFRTANSGSVSSAFDAVLPSSKQNCVVPSQQLLQNIPLHFKRTTFNNLSEAKLSWWLQTALDTLKYGDIGAPSGTKLYYLPFPVVATIADSDARL